MPIALLALVVVAVAHLGAQVTAPGGVVADLTQILLMPALLWVLLAGTPNPTSLLVRLVGLALALSWLGDTLPRFAQDGSDLGFGLMLTYVLGQTLITLAVSHRDRSMAARRA